ncbi:MAG: 30S ribosomal protein S14 [Planctomycetota bacterium]
MAKQSSISKNARRQRLAELQAPKREKLLKILRNPELDWEERDDARRKLMKLARNGHPTRIKNRCNVTGRPRGYLRKFGLSRVTFRELALNAEIPGVRKASW